MFHVHTTAFNKPRAKAITIIGITYAVIPGPLIACQIFRTVVSARVFPKYKTRFLLPRYGLGNVCIWNGTRDKRDRNKGRVRCVLDVQAKFDVQAEN